MQQVPDAYWLSYAAVGIPESRPIQRKLETATDRIIVESEKASFGSLMGYVQTLWTQQ